MGLEDSTQQQQQQGYWDLVLEGKLSQTHNQSSNSTTVFSFVIFSLLMLFSMCFIYTVYRCTDRCQNAMMMEMEQRLQPANNQPSSAVQMSLFIPEFFRLGVGLDPEAINSLPILSYGTANIGKDGDCSICLADFQYGEKLKSVPHCCHAFHSECLDRWLLAQSNCPLS